MELGKVKLNEAFQGLWMNMPPPMESNAFHSINDILHNAYCTVATNSTLNASKEVPTPADEIGIKGVVANFDGTWQHRGFSSLNSVSHLERWSIMLYCAKHALLASTGDHTRIHQHLKIGNGTITAQSTTLGVHTGSAGSMETSSVKQIFEQSMAEKNIYATLNT